MTMPTGRQKFRIERPEGPVVSRIQLPTSKSISNRVLIIQALSGSDELIEGLSEADDTKKLQEILHETPTIMDVGNAGTVMRFLCAYLSILPGTWILTGSQRMRERPIAPLVEALRSLGAEITYLEQENFPPLKIIGRKLSGGKIQVDSALSSQFATALMMVGPYLKGGLKIELSAAIASRSYLELTKSVMHQFGISVEESNDVLSIPEGRYNQRPFRVPADHSSASYWAGMAVLSGGSEFTLEGLQLDDAQGDRRIFEILAPLLQVEQKSDGLLIKNLPNNSIDRMDIDLASTPDLFPTLAFALAGLGVETHLSGLKSLPHKETDRLLSVQQELANMGVEMRINEDHSVHIPASDLSAPKRPFRSYKDHRMVMCAAMMATIFDSIEVEDPMAVEKSYPTFWKDMERAGFRVEAIG